LPVRSLTVQATPAIKAFLHIFAGHGVHRHVSWQQTRIRLILAHLQKEKSSSPRLTAFCAEEFKRISKTLDGVVWQ
jgi:hypothetical protein